MADRNTGASTRTSRVINASREAIYRALTDPDALVSWRTPGEMTARMHGFALRVGGGYGMSLYYPASDDTSSGKTIDNEDRYTARFVELEPPARLVEAITFASDDPAFASEMTMEVVLEERGGQTEVTFSFHNLPSGMRPQDNDAGTRSSLEKLARFVESR